MKRKLDAEQIEEIRNRPERRGVQKELALEFGVSQGRISQIRNAKAKPEVPGVDAQMGFDFPDKPLNDNWISAQGSALILEHND